MIKITEYIRRNWFNALMICFVALMLFSPSAKAWVLQQVMRTGLFNATIPENASQIKNESATVSEKNSQLEDFQFIDINGRIQNTEDHRGKVLFINFWASWCPPCRAEFPSIQALYTKFKDHPDVLFLLINEDADRQKGIDYLIESKYDIPFYQARSTISQDIYAGSLPTTVVVDKQGVIRMRHVGFARYDGKAFLASFDKLLNEAAID
jgi:thiol-disulfide isomerase/thioredoxin